MLKRSNVKKFSELQHGGSISTYPGCASISCEGEKQTPGVKEAPCVLVEPKEADGTETFILLP